jgi:hypothetical protein
LQKFDIVTLFLGVYLGIQKFRARNPVYQEVDSCIKKCAKTHLRASGTSKNFPGASPPFPSLPFFGGPGAKPPEIFFDVPDVRVAQL